MDTIAKRLRELTSGAVIVCKRQALEAAVDTSDGLRFTLSTENPDLAGDVVVQAGLMPAYSPLPAMIDHGRDVADLIGTWKDMTSSGPRTSARLELLPQGLSRGADLVRGIHKAGVRLGASVKFLPVEAEPIYEEGAKPAKGATRRIVGFKFLRARLVEASIVPMPCNAEALAEVGKSLQTDQRAAWDQLIRAEAALYSVQRERAVAASRRLAALLNP